MLSIIICSINPLYLASVTNNIAETIGIEYELLVFDNRQSKLGICSVYNQQAAKANYSLLLFLHEDVVFRTKEWGSILTDIFNNQSIGLVGLAGSNYKSKMFSGWFTNNAKLDAINILHNVNGEEIKLTQHRPNKADLYEVVCLDGVFITSRKDVWEETKFNDAKLKGFHFYDLDFSLRAGQKNKLYVTMNIDLDHITQGGDFGDKWVKEAFIFHEYMNSLLPFPRKTAEESGSELRIANTWLDYLKIHKISLSNKFKWIIKQRLFLYPKLYYGIIKLLVYEPLGLRKVHRLLKKYFE